MPICPSDNFHVSDYLLAVKGVRDPLNTPLTAMKLICALVGSGCSFPPLLSVYGLGWDHQAFD
jgi:hypothetical protein